MGGKDDEVPEGRLTRLSQKGADWRKWDRRQCRRSGQWSAIAEAIAGSPVRPLQIQPDTSLGMFPFVQYHHRRSLAPFGGFSNPVVLCGNALPGLH